MKHIGHSKFWQEVESGKWEPETFEILKKYCKKDKIFIDIGAWNGVCSIFSSELGSICYAIEPDNQALKALKKNVNLNDGCIHIIPACITGISGDIELKTQYKNGFGNSMSSILDRGLVTDSIMVKGMTLEHFIEHEEIKMNNVCLIKIDIEGGEIELIKQAESFLKKHKPTIYLSVHPVWFPNLDDDTNLIADILFGIYRVFDTSGREYERWEFLEAVNSGVHSFVLEV